MAGRKIYRNTNVLEEAQKRISLMFDKFENIVVSVSGGKDSTVLYEMARQEAVKRNKKLNLFFLDQEAEYQSTIDMIEYMMSQKGINPYWYQVPVRMTNSTSFKDNMLYSWGEGQSWVREKSKLSIKHIDGKYPDRFYTFIRWFESQWGSDTCHLVGLRAEESLNRLRAVVKNPGFENYVWTTKTKGHITAYPLYDWTFEDVWHHIAINNIKYNKLYDFLYSRGFDIKEARVSNLVHEKSFSCLTYLQEFEPETYEKLMKRIGGVHVAARYAKEGMIYNNKKLPPRFKNWKEYRDFLLTTLPDDKLKEKMTNRFKNYDETEYIYKQQCKQVLLFDWENNIPVKKQKEKESKISEWRKIL